MTGDRRLLTLTCGLMTVACVLMTLICGLTYWKRVPSFGVVDSQKIVAHQAKLLANQYPKGVVPLAKLQEVGDSLKGQVEEWAQANGMILIAKGAVWGGDLTDYTDTFMEIEDSHPLPVISRQSIRRTS